MRTCRLVTLGCKVNQYETQYVKETLELNGYREAGEGEPADVCVVNTCTVTREGDAKSRQSIRRLHQEQPNAAIVVMGCYATRDPQAVKRLPGVAQVIEDKQKLADELKPWGVTHLPRGITRFDGHQRAFVKVQDGCLLRCSYCIIPSVRPVVRSRTVEEICDEVSALAGQGYQEVVLTGVHLGHYGFDLSRGKPKQNWTRLWHLLRALNGLAGEFRIRLSSLEAAEARDDLVQALRDLPRVVPHLHLCLQSGSDRILARMKRRYTSKGFLERCRRIRTALDRPAFTTDVIIGFPGETEDDFRATLDVLREVGFCKIHVFSYSPREGTPAAELKESLPPAIVNERRERVREVEKELARQYGVSLAGCRLDVLIEGANPKQPGWAMGTSCRFVPVSVRGFAPALVGKRIQAVAQEPRGDVLLGEPLALMSDWAANARELHNNRSLRVALPLAQS